MDHAGQNVPSYNYGIYSEQSDIRMDGEGSLTIEVGDTSGGSAFPNTRVISAGIYANWGSVEVVGGTITIETGDAKASSVSSAESYGIYADSGDVVLSDGTVKTTSGSAVAESGDAYSNGIHTRGEGTVTISGGEVTANAGTDGNPAVSTADLTIAPQAGQQITAEAGSEETSASAVNGSPFSVQTSITDLVSDASYFHADTHVHVGTLVQGKAATCEETGMKSYYTCDECGKHFEDETCTSRLPERQCGRRKTLSCLHRLRRFRCRRSAYLECGSRYGGQRQTLYDLRLCGRGTTGACPCGNTCDREGGHLYGRGQHRILAL